MSKTDEERDSEILDQAARMLEQTAEYQKLVEKLKPLVETIQSSSEKVGEFREFIKPLQTRFEKSGQRMLLFKEDSKADYDSRLNTLRKAFSFLALFETSVANILNCMVILLILNGHDFFIQYTRKYAKSLDDLDDSFGVAEKLDFLNFHGFSFLTENINKSLRNKIAHMDFDIEEKGVVIVEKQRYDLRTEIVKLEAVLLLATRALKNSGFASL
jgi:hypothetical protein